MNGVSLANSKPTPLAASRRYDGLATYDETRRADVHLLARLKAQLALKAEAHYLDIGCGTGNYTCALQAIGGVWTGLEPSATMLAKARAKNSNINWRQGAAETLPFLDPQFDAILCQLSLHHFTDLNAAFAAMAQALKPHGRIILFTVLPTQARRFWLKHYFPKMIETDAASLPALQAITHAAQNAGLSIGEPQPYVMSAQSTDLSFYSGKNRPQTYLEAAARKNMSPFRLFCSPDELASGLAALSEDIASGAVQAHMDAADGSSGDYCFLRLDKAVSNLK